MPRWWRGTVGVERKVRLRTSTRHEARQLGGIGTEETPQNSVIRAAGVGFCGKVVFTLRQHPVDTVSLRGLCASFNHSGRRRSVRIPGQTIHASHPFSRRGPRRRDHIAGRRPGERPLRRDLRELEDDFRPRYERPRPHVAGPARGRQLRRPRIRRHDRRQLAGASALSRSRRRQGLALRHRRRPAGLRVGRHQVDHPQGRVAGLDASARRCCKRRPDLPRYMAAARTTRSARAPCISAAASIASTARTSRRPSARRSRRAASA